MKKVCARILLVAAVLATAFSMRLGGTSSAAAPASQVTFYRDVLPILQSNCQSCHRPGEVAPMSLLTYEQSRPYAKAIKEKVLARKMPPWFADPEFGHFANARTLSPQENSWMAGTLESRTWCWRCRSLFMYPRKERLIISGL